MEFLLVLSPSLLLPKSLIKPIDLSSLIHFGLSQEKVKCTKWAN